MEFHYLSTYDSIHLAPTIVLRKKLFIPKNFLTLFFVRSTADNNKSEGVDVGVTKSSTPFDSVLARVKKFIMTRRNSSLSNSMYKSNIPLEYTQLD